jgi:hypothetical protein
MTDEEKKAYRKWYRETHKEQIRERARLYRKRRRDEIREYDRKYVAEHRGVVLGLSGKVPSGAQTQITMAALDLILQIIGAALIPFTVWVICTDRDLDN